MKYTIEGFLQEKLLELDLNDADAHILRWFLDFAACGKMKRFISENENHEKNVYYWINYQAVLEELPILRITSTKSIQRAFNKYVELGLLSKIVRSGGSKGYQSFYAINEKALELEYSTVPAAFKITANEKKIKSEVEVSEEESISYSGQECPVENTHWTEMSSANITVDKNVQSGLDKNVQSLYINSSIKNSSTTLSYPSETRAEILKKSVMDFFDGSLALFSDDLIPKLDQLTSKLEENKLSPYVKYTWLLVKAQKPKKIHGMFYKIILQKNTLDSFVTSLSGEAAKVKYTNWICPVCGNANNIVDDCSVCETQYSLRNDQKHIYIQKQLFNLPKDKLNKLKNELFETLASASYKDYRLISHNVYQKYGIKEIN